MDDETKGAEQCGAECGGRRDFLREAALVAVGLLVASGARPAAAERLDVALLKATRRQRGQITYPIPAADGAHIDRDNEVIMVRFSGRAYAFSLSCPHQRTMLRWDEGNRRFQCPKHHSRYTPDGTFVSGRATRGMDRYGVRREGTSLVVELDQLIRQDRDRAGWDAAFAAL